jgi:class 3 adenylate cyclase
MTRQPSGLVTFLFTDIEGSTRLLRALGAERYGVALQDHCDLLRAAFERHEGYEVNYEGDSFFIAFASAREAVAAAQDARRALTAHAWPDEGALRVRMGIHTGRPLLAPPKYVGLDIHRAARIAAAGHGGQVLVSAATADALEPGAFELRDLGEHRFKDLSAPEHVYQLGDGDFAPLNALYRTNLPIPPRRSSAVSANFPRSSSCSPAKRSVSSLSLGRGARGRRGSRRKRPERLLLAFRTVSGGST